MKFGWKYASSQYNLI